MVKKYRNYFYVLISLVILASIGLILVKGIHKGNGVSEIFQAYKSSWEKQDFKGMYGMLSKEVKAETNEQQFIDRYTNIYKGIGAQNISLTIVNADELKKYKGDTIKIPFSISMDTSAGKLHIPNYTLTLSKESIDNKKQWTIVWNEALIFPEMVQGDKVRVVTLYSKRGEIFDNNGKGLAINGTIIELGIYPAKFLKNKNTNITEMARILDIQPSIIDKKLKSVNNPELFVPIVNITSTEKEKISKVMAIPGVLYQKLKGRVYPGGEAFGSLIGYIGPITAEELNKNKSEGYRTASAIGKAGLEQVYEKRLKGENGEIIYISKQKDGKEVQKIILGKKEPRKGETIKLSVDSDLQKKIYHEMNNNAGACAAINPKSGEVLALVSSPSYDSNLYTTYIPDSIKQEWNKNDKKPYVNRFKKVYAPGSTFKLVTSVIGLNKGKINPDEKVNIKGLKWQQNKSWGNYMITRVEDPGKPENLTDALVYSDNIYFAKIALKIGAIEFVKGCKAFGIGETLPIDYPIQKSQISNSGDITSNISLADSGYGQGQVLMSPLHVALMYSSLVNDGNIMVPTITSFTPGTSAKVWKKNLISKENIKTLVNCFTAVIDNPSGTGHAAKMDGTPLAGKTGTAELKKNAEDKSAEENGWFTCMNTTNPRIVVSMIIENVKNRGESHYVVPIVKRVIESYLTK